MADLLPYLTAFSIGGLLGFAGAAIVAFDRFDDDESLDTQRINQLVAHGLTISCVPNAAGENEWAVISGGGISRTVIGDMSTDLRVAIDSALEATNG